MRWPLIRFLPSHTHFDFVKWAPFAAVLSTLCIVGSIFSFVTHGLNLGIDFAGGTMIEVVTPGAAPLAALRTDLLQIGVHDPQVQGFGAPNSALLRFKPAENVSAVDSVALVRQRLSARVPGIQFKSITVVGPKVSGELFRSGFIALAIAIGLMLLYIWFRFQLQFGFGAVVAIAHDIFLTIGVLSVLQIEFSMTSIAALLTVIGYSMNEKVITFDRLRENLGKYRKTPLREVINLSENERLSRTMITGTTAILALVGALFLGGPALFPLVFTMVFGIIIGTYSSIYVALPVILLWGVNRDAGEAAPLKSATQRP
ncbi:MAG TPA: protein translocase subunit SecF [Caulobacteraceae bacterium]|jgi:preprotein translocase subunit SecF|nr:protein translocase subunit SecF [Caulobacteraceae bacterium]